MNLVEVVGQVLEEVVVCLGEEQEGGGQLTTVPIMAALNVGCVRVCAFVWRYA